MDNVTVCDKFQSTILEGQLCYTLDIARVVKIADNPTRSGKFNGLLLLLDPTPFDQSSIDKNARGQVFKVVVHTLAPYSTFGSGSYRMSTLKKMTGTANFKQLPDHQKKCLVHDRQECQARNYLEQIRKECRCLPWALQTNQVRESDKNQSDRKE